MHYSIEASFFIIIIINYYTCPTTVSADERLINFWFEGCAILAASVPTGKAMSHQRPDKVCAF